MASYHRNEGGDGEGKNLEDPVERHDNDHVAALQFHLKEEKIENTVSFPSALVLL